MCGRFALGDMSWDDMRGWLGLTGEAPMNMRPRWNIPPQTQIVIARRKPQGLVATAAHWRYLPHGWRRPESAFRLTTFNARIDQGAVKPTFQDAVSARRCLIPAIGYYEWPKSNGPRGRQAWLVTTPERRFCMAGLWSLAAPEGRDTVTCAVLTTAAAPSIAQIHPRMPVMLRGDQHADWLSGALSLADVAAPPPADALRAWPVGPRVNAVRNDGPDLISPVAEIPEEDDPQGAFAF